MIRSHAFVKSLLVLASIIFLSTNVCLLNIGKPYNNDNNGPAEIQSRSVPRVACFLMTRAKDFDYALSVRYSIWGRQCSRFAIVTNSFKPSEEMKKMDETTYILYISTILEQQLQRLNYTIPTDTINDKDNEYYPSNYIKFPAPDQETKDSLALKAFYTWLAVADLFLNNENSSDIDYVMKVDPDTYMLMDNYLDFLSQTFRPNQHAYIGRVFKADNDPHRPFVSGLSVTLSRATLQLFHQKATIEEEPDSSSNKCSAMQFGVPMQALEDYAVSQCLQSLGVYPAFSLDDNGQERFMHFDPILHASHSASFPAWYRSFSLGGPQETCCSPKACAFHYVKAEKQNSTLLHDAKTRSWYWDETDAS